MAGNGKARSVCFFTDSRTWGGSEIHTLQLVTRLAEHGCQVAIAELHQELFRAALAEKGAVASQAQRIGEGRLTEKCSEVSPSLARRGSADGLEHRQTPAPPRIVADRGVSVSRIERRGKPRSILGWRTLMGCFRADVCVLVKCVPNAASWRFDAAARWAYPRYVTIEHMVREHLPPRTRGRHCGGIVPGLGLWWYRRWLEGYSRSIAPHAIICVSEAVRKRLVGDYRYAAKKVHTVRNGVDVERFGPCERYRRETRRAWNIPEEAFVFGSLGRLNPDKGPDAAVEAFARVVRELPARDVRLVLAGEGPMGSALRQMVAERGLHDRVLFAGHCPQPWEVYPAFDCFVLPSRQESLGLSLLEAMASEVPPIAMRVGGVPEVLSDASCGWLSPDQDAFSEAMLSVVQMSPAERSSLGARARRHVEEHFNAEVQLEQLAGSILDRRRFTSGSRGR